MSRIVTCVVMLAIVLVSGCARNRRSDALNTTLKAYAKAVRWNNIAGAWQFVDPRVRAAHPLSVLDKSRFQQVQISGYDACNGPLPAGPDRVIQSVNIDLVNRHTQSGRRIIDHQTWRYDPAKKRWWLESGLPDLTQQPQILP